MRLSAAKGRLDRSLNTAEQELQEAQQQILMLQVRTHHESKRDHLPQDTLWLPDVPAPPRPGGLFGELFHTFVRDEEVSLQQSELYQLLHTSSVQTFAFVPLVFL